MHVTFRLRHLAGGLLLAAASLAGAESPLPDPVAPAVIGRPLDQLRPVRPQRARPAPAKLVRRAQVAAAARVQPPAPPAPAVVQQAPAPQLAATQVLGNRPEPRPPVPGGYFSSKDQVLVRMYYDSHPIPGQPKKWKIGQPIPPGAELTGVPDGLRAALSTLPRGHQYVEVDGEVVLVAVPTRTIVDGISRDMR